MEIATTLLVLCSVIVSHGAQGNVFTYTALYICFVGIDLSLYVLFVRNNGFHLCMIIGLL